MVAAELRYGAGLIPILPMDDPADRIYGRLRAGLEQAGTPFGPNDLLIASQALAADCGLVTDNVREFSKVEGLVIENWLRDG